MFSKKILRVTLFVSSVMEQVVDLSITFGLSFLSPARHLIILTPFRHFRNLRNDFSDFLWKLRFQVCMDEINTVHDPATFLLRRSHF